VHPAVRSLIAYRRKTREKRSSMPHPCLHHCPPGRGGGAAALAALVVLVVIAVTARAVVHAAELVLEVAAIAGTSAVVLAVLGGVA
jgi:hypothetical protein